MNPITFCLPVKSNLRYLKACIPSIRENASRKDHAIVIYVDEDKDGTVKWLESVKEQYGLEYYVNTSGVLTGIGKGYDFCIDKAKTDVVMIFHADMMLGKNADELAFKHLAPKTVVCCTRVEPPLHPAGPEKIVLNFGMWPEEDGVDGFKKSEFNAFVDLQSKVDKVTHGCFAPWMLYKADFDAIGGHDRIFHSYHEDSDLFNRLSLSGYSFNQPWNALVYHLTCRGGVFEEGIQQKSPRVMAMLQRSYVEFIRKWGTPILHTPELVPIVKNRYTVAFVIDKAINYELVRFMEPWADAIYIDNDVYQKKLIEEIQPTTSYDMKKRIFLTSDEPKENVVIRFDMTHLTNHSLGFLTKIPEILQDSGEVGEMEYDVFKVNIKSLETFNAKLISAVDSWHTQRLL